MLIFATGILAEPGKSAYHWQIGDERLSDGSVMNTNNSRYWFRAKRYGLGWGLPLAWQGWAFSLSWLVIVLSGGRLLAPGGKPMRWLFLAAMVFILLAVCYWKGDPKGRRWNGGDGN